MATGAFGPPQRGGNRSGAGRGGGLGRLLTARPFFEGRGYRALWAQRVERRGVALTNYRMEKAL